ncbi:MAG: DUF362 domain-containing protein [Spirochaetes bacterium]|jgi:uncharacterized protein (DUF362 family)|nr:DUF362 domain-containing protein [Spirochaetota bacterium]
MNKIITRKEFIQKCMSISVISSAALHGLVPKDLFGSTSSTLVAVRGGEPDKLFDKGIKALGGMSNFVKKGQTVLIKPNIGWDKDPVSGANTNPLLVRRVAEHCINAGAKKVYVYDHSCNHWVGAYKNSGIEQAAKDGGAEVPHMQGARYFNKVKVPKGKTLKEVEVHSLVQEADVFINIPILKHHGGAKMTSAMKNLMGAVWDRSHYHRSGLHQCIADFCTYRVPDLNIIDAYTVMHSNGPRGYSKKDLVIKKMQLLSTDIVAADAASAAIIGFPLSQIHYIAHANNLGLGESDLNKVKSIKLAL